MHRSSLCLAAVGIALCSSLAGCAPETSSLTPTVPTSPGPAKSLTEYQNDNLMCSGFAQSQIGAVDPMTLSTNRPALQQRFDSTYGECMSAHGEQVAGYPTVAASPPAASTTPDAALIRATQTELIRMGLLSGVPDGLYGPKTRAAIQTFERSHGLPVDGLASPRLLDMLGAIPTGAPRPSAP